MEEQIIKYENAKLAKDKGFNEICDSCYDINGKSYRGMNHKNELGEGVFSAPTQSLLQKWLREEHKIIVNSYANASGYCWEVHYTPERGGTHIADSAFSGPNESGNWDTYEEALEKGLQYGLKLIEL